MRIVAGRNRGRLLAEPEDRSIRPSSDRLREAVFNILAHPAEGRPPLPQGAMVLDVFAGTGALGFEALSRGAVHVVFLEKSPQALKLIAENVKRMGAEKAATILARDATAPGRLPPGQLPADLVFIDPPYGQGLIETALGTLLPRGWLRPGTLVAAEHDAEETLAEITGLSPLNTRRYGKGAVTFLRVEDR